MKNLPDLVTYVKQWLTKAEHDLKSAEQILKLDDDECPFDSVCFHAQQCAEKCIKALLSYRRIDFPRAHDLTELVVLLPAKESKLFDGLILETLNPYAVESRYPGDWEEILRPEALSMVAKAKRVRRIVRSLLPKWK